MITLEQLARLAIGASDRRLSKFVEPLNDAMQEYAIDTPQREAAFISHVCHESGSFYVLREMSSGMEYEGRRDLGNFHPGDGPRYKGRGLLKIVGRQNYELVGDGLHIRLINNPDLLEEHPHSSRSSAWYWAEYLNLNRMADQKDYFGITKRITGSYRDIYDRAVHYGRALTVLGVNS